MVEETREKSNGFKKNSIILLLLLGILIVISVLTTYSLHDYEINNIGEYEIQNFSMGKFSLFSRISTIIFAVLVTIYIIDGLFRNNIASTSFVERINYKGLFTVLLLLMIIGAASFFLELAVVEGDIADLTWGSFILGIISLIILGIVSIIGTCKIIEEIKKAEL